MKPPPATGLDPCVVCGEDFVGMVHCTRAGSGTWWLLLRCGGCGTWHETFARDEAVAALRRAIRRGVRAVAERVQRLDRERMESQVEAFSHALALDLIGPDDFR